MMREVFPLRVNMNFGPTGLGLLNAHMARARRQSVVTRRLWQVVSRMKRARLAWMACIGPKAA